MYEYTYEATMKKFVIWKHAGLNCFAILVTNTEEKAKRATQLFEKFGAGTLTYPTK